MSETLGFLDLMRERDQLAQVTHPEELAEHLASAQRTAYIGFDPTAISLHVGHLLAVMGLRRWQQAGHRVIALVGGGTVLVGDPTGKTEMRQMLEAEQIASNVAAIKGQLGKFLDLSDPAKGLMVNNADWLRPLNYLEFLREVGPHFSVNRMLTAECFKQRLEKGLSFLEFNYMLLQSYDFLHLYREHACTVQMGGDDQWSNMLGGMELVRRLASGQAFCFTFPLLATSDGKKMGKTEKGAVWLDSDLTPPYDYFQFWRNIDDAMVRRCLLNFTEMPVDEIDELTREGGSAINVAKERLAFEATKLNHGATAADDCRATARKLFAGDSGGGNEPEFTLGRTVFGEGMNVVELLCVTKIFDSKGEVRRLIQQNGLALNGEKVTDAGYVVPQSTLDGPDGCLVKKGKKHYYRLRFSD